MKKYWLIIRNTWDESLTYRLNFVLWRVRMVIRFLITYFLWSSIYSGNVGFFGYTRETILTYVLLVYIVSNFVLSTRTQEIGSEINDGKLTNYLIKPVSFFKSIIARDISDKILNFIFTIIECGFLIIILKPQIVYQTSIFLLISTVTAFVGAVMLYFCISLLLGFMGFWTNEIWATRFIFFILLDFLSGSFFPIDILPPAVYKILLLTPFPYILYFPVKIYLGQLTAIQIGLGFCALTVWCFILMYVIAFVWKKGLQIYTAEGR